MDDYGKRQRLDGKVALVTGAAQGLGAACAAALAQAGARVLLTDVLEEQGRKTAASIVEIGLAVEFARLGLGIRVNSVHPGFIRTAMVDRGFQDLVRLGFAKDIPGVEEVVASQFLGGFGMPADVAGTVCFLASEAASHINGIALAIDGGSLAA